MSNLPRIFIIYAVAIPVALVLGYTMSDLGSDPDLLSVGLVALVLFALALPIILHAYLPIMLFCWNATIIAFFLPGAPSFYLVMTFSSLLLLVVQRGMTRSSRTLWVPSVSWPMLAMAAVVIITAAARGGIGIHALGSSTNNGKKYIEILAAVVGYFVLSRHEIPRKRAMLYASLFFVGGVTPAFGDLIYIAGPKFYWLYNIVSSAQAGTLASSEAAFSLGIFRVEGCATAAVAFCGFMLVRYGIKGILDLRHPWRMALLLIALVAVLAGGYRGRLFLIAVFFIIQFFFEGLWRTWLMPVAVVIVMVGLGVVFVYSDRLPDAMQRSISFLPVKVKLDVAADAQYSVQWREDMWSELVPQIPQYLLLGKGYGFSDGDYFITTQMVQSYMSPSYEPFILSGEYHNGPLSALIPLGIFGTLAFLWFLIAAWRLVWKNFRNGDPDLRLINTFLLTYYTAKAILFFSIFGALETDLAAFAGVVGLSVAINGGVKRRKDQKAVNRLPFSTPLAKVEQRVEYAPWF